MRKKYIVEEEEDEDSYKDLSSGEEEDDHQAPEDLLASVTTVVKVDTISKSPAKGGGSYAQMYKNKKSNDNLQQPKNIPTSKGQAPNPRICQVNDSLVSLSAIKNTNMNLFPQRYQADLTCSYSISESSIPEPQAQQEEDEDDEEEMDDYENEEQEEENSEHPEEEEQEEDDNQEEQEEEYEEEDQEECELPQEEEYEEEEGDEETADLKSTYKLNLRNSNRSSLARSSIRTSIVEDVRHFSQHQNPVAYESEDENEIEEIAEEEDEEKELIDEEIDEAVLPPNRSISKSMLKNSMSEKIISEESSLANTIKTEIENDEDEEGDDYKDLEELEADVQESDFTETENNHVHSSLENHQQEEDFPIIVTSHVVEQKKPQPSDMKENILQSISLFKQYKANQVSQSVVGLDYSAKKLKPTTEQPLRVSKVLEIPKPNINLNESISENDMDKIKKQNHLLRMQLLEQQRMIEEGKAVLQERIEQEIEKAKSQALKEFISSKKQQTPTPVVPVEPKPEKKTLRDVKKPESPEKNEETIKVKESSKTTINTSKSKKKEVIEILPDDFENTTDMKKQMEIRNKKFLEVRKQKIEKIEETKKKEKSQPVPSTNEAKTAENGMILKNMKQQNKTNKLLIKNALIHLTLAGEVNKKEREDVFEAMKEYEDNSQMIILVREVNVPAFRALYAVVTDGVNANVGSSTSTTDSNRTDNSSRSESPGFEKRPDQVLVKKIIGKGPKFLTEDVVDVFCRYDSGGKKLSKLASRTFGVTTDVVVLKAAATKKIKR